MQVTASWAAPPSSCPSAPSVSLSATGWCWARPASGWRTCDNLVPTTRGGDDAGWKERFLNGAVVLDRGGLAAGDWALA